MAAQDKNLADIVHYMKTNELAIPLDIVNFVGLEVTKKISSDQSVSLLAHKEDIYITDEAQVIILPQEHTEQEDSVPSIGQMILDLMDLGEYDKSDAGYEELHEMAQKALRKEIPDLATLKTELKNIEKTHFVNPSILRRVSRWVGAIVLDADTSSTIPPNVLSFAEAQKNQFIKNQKALYKTNQIAKAILFTCFVAVVIHFVQINKSQITGRKIASVNEQQLPDLKPLFESGNFEQAEIELLSLRPSEEENSESWEKAMEELVFEHIRYLLLKGTKNKIGELIQKYQDKYTFLKNSERLNKILEDRALEQ